MDWLLFGLFAGLMLAGVPLAVAMGLAGVAVVGGILYGAMCAWKQGDLKRLVAELPLHYQRREDAIREYTTINAKIDRLTEVLIDIRGVMNAKQN